MALIFDGLIFRSFFLLTFCLIIIGNNIRPSCLVSSPDRVFHLQAGVWNQVFDGDLGRVHGGLWYATPIRKWIDAWPMQSELERRLRHPFHSIIKRAVPVYSRWPITRDKDTGRYSQYWPFQGAPATWPHVRFAVVGSVWRLWQGELVPWKVHA